MPTALRRFDFAANRRARMELEVRLPAWLGRRASCLPSYSTGWKPAAGTDWSIRRVCRTDANRLTQFELVRVI